MSEVENAWKWYKSIGSPKYAVAPMVEQSELAWRLLSRMHGASLTYTPMFHAKQFSESQKYRDECWKGHQDSDTPLIVQFCANDPEILLKAARLVQDQCVAVDLNLGCPQHIAKRGNYGAFLMDESGWHVISGMVSLLAKELSVPITCKIRVFETIEKTVRYAKMIQDAGCTLLTVHGRLREQKGTVTGMADWRKIKAVKEALDIPVFANGNMIYHSDLDRCMQETGVDGVMSAEGNLYNPALFTPTLFASWFLVDQYLSIIDASPISANSSQAKAHIFKMFHACLAVHVDLRERLGSAYTFEQIKNITEEMKIRLIEVFGSQDTYNGPIIIDQAGIIELPIWVSQPMVRKHDPLKIAQEAESAKRTADLQLTGRIKAPKHEPQICTSCKNTAASACPFKQCKAHCNQNSHTSDIKCEVHIGRKAKKRALAGVTKPLKGKKIMLSPSPDARADTKPSGWQCRLGCAPFADLAFVKQSQQMFRQLVRNSSTKSPLLPLYARPEHLFISGQGCYLTDSRGRKFLDFTSGIAVNALGHNHTDVVKIISDQAGKLIHLSNLYHNEYAEGLAQMIVDSLDKVGTIADGQFAKKYAKKTYPDQPNKIGIVSFSNAFHGRTLGSLSATPNPKYQSPFLPLMPGFQTLPFNELSSVEKITSDICAVIVEPVQGEGGIHSCTPEFISALKIKCNEVGALLIYDEIQCGIGRTGKMFGFQTFCNPACTFKSCVTTPKSCISPDMITMAKPLAAGLPLGAVILAPHVAKIMKAGDHGTTYGGGPLGTRVGQFAWKTISNPAFLEHVEKMGALIQQKGDELAKTSPLVKHVRGKGLLKGIELRESVPTSLFVDLCREKGVLVVSASSNTIRLIPALIVTEKEINEAFVVFDKVISQMEGLLASGLK